MSNVLNNVAIVDLDVHIWSGRKKLRADDLKLNGKQIPPEDLASLGSKRTMSAKALAPFEKFKKRAERACMDYGYRFLSGYAIPLDKQKVLSEKLDEIRKEFRDERTKFIANYDKEVDEWINGHPDWEEVIRTAITPLDVVKERISFAYYMFQVTSANITSGTDDLDEAVSSMGDQILNEVAKTASEIFDKSYLGREAIRAGNMHKLIGRQRDKLDSLSFVDHRLVAIVERIDQGLADLPKSGMLEGSDLNAVAGILGFMRDPQSALEHGERIEKASIQTDPTLAEDDDSVSLDELPAPGDVIEDEIEPEPPQLKKDKPADDAAWFY